jgi:hypothetical protein
MSTDKRQFREEESRDCIPEDDSFLHHKKTDSPWWNEAAWFGFMIPERKIDGFFYMWHRPNMNLTAAGAAVWDQYGEEKHNCLHYEWYHFNALADGSDMFNYELTNGMKMKLLKPLWRYQLQYKSESCDIDLIWEGVFPPKAMAYTRNKGVEQFGGYHYEQIGHVTGTVRIEDEVLPVDCHHIRDRSWGERKFKRDHAGGGLDMGWASERTAFCMTMLRPKPRAPLMPVTPDVPGYGQMIKDGRVTTVVAAERRVTERRPDGCPLKIEIDLRDEEGRQMHAVGRIENVLKYDDLWYVHWCLCRWTIDGEEGWGESQDWLEQDVIRSHQRQASKASGKRFGA